jgi:triosephosphate isomerase
MEPVLIAANWKMYKTAPEAEAFFAQWRGALVPQGREVAFFPPFPLLALVRSLLPSGQRLGGQNAHEAEEGAFTGEISGAMLRDAGCTYVLLGHSERRHLFGETDARIAAKVRTAFRHGLRPVLCVGERLEDREAGRTMEVVLGQLAAGLGETPPAGEFDVAYEPVWAIGTGKVAQPEDAAQVHAAIRDWLEIRRFGKDARILYGGSVKPGNAPALLATPGVQGLLVGGASLDPHEFAAIVAA